jgi:hypothetical protein
MGWFWASEEHDDHSDKYKEGKVLTKWNEFPELVAIDKYHQVKSPFFSFLFFTLLALLVLRFAVRLCSFIITLIIITLQKTVAWGCADGALLCY